MSPTGKVGQRSMPALLRQTLRRSSHVNDAEVPDLCRAVPNGEVKTRSEIKQRIKNWKPDTLRA